MREHTFCFQVLHIWIISKKITRAQNFSLYVSLGSMVTSQKSIYYEELSQLNVEWFTSTRQIYNINVTVRAWVNRRINQDMKT